MVKTFSPRATERALDPAFADLLALDEQAFAVRVVAAEAGHLGTAGANGELPSAPEPAATSPLGPAIPEFLPEAAGLPSLPGGRLIRAEPDASPGAPAPQTLSPAKDTIAGADNGYAANALATSATTAPASTSALINGLLSGYKWNAAISYSDPDAASDYLTGYVSNTDGDGVSAQNEGFSRLSAKQLLAAQFALDATTLSQPAGASGFSVEGFTNLGVSYAAGGSGNATIRLANSSDADPTAYAWYPSSGSTGGDAFFGNYYDTLYGGALSLKTPTAGNYAWHTMLHELGHSLGLKHGQQAGGPANMALPTAYDSIEFTVMTYRSYVGALPDGYTYETWGGPQTYMQLDIQALQYLYGADFTANSGDTVYKWTPTSGNTLVNGATGIAAGGNRIFATIWDGGGTDTYDLSSYATALRLDLRPGESSLFSSAQRADLDIFEPGAHMARGNIFNALQYNGDARSLIENATGGSGSDTLTGNQANNILRGGGGNDVLDGSTGNDTLDGGTGNNTASYASLGGAVVASLLLAGAQQNTSAGGYDTLLNIQNLTASNFGSSLTGDGNANALTGGNGADTLRGGAGSDTLRGGQGVDAVDGGADNDVIYGGAAGDTLTGGGGNDTFWFIKGQPQGDTLTDFVGNGASFGDLLKFQGYSALATFQQLDATHWLLADGGASETLTFANGAAIHASDFAFV